MASLKEIRGRIASVGNTRKITGAMKMVSSAKLHRAQDAIFRFLPYWNKISGIMDTYLENNIDADLGELTEVRKVNRLAIVVLSSNTGLCGAYNINVQKKLSEVLASYNSIPAKDITIYFIGKKVYDEFAAKNAGYEITGYFPELSEKPNYEGLNKLTNELMASFISKKFDKLELVYNQFKSTAIQLPVNEVLLPVTVTVEETTAKRTTIDYIIEPSPQELSEVLTPTVVRLQMYRALLNSYASEHGTRTTAMQIATDNADELIDDLKLQYNKLRQDAITNELIDIVGGSEVFR
mgnify:FL=1